MKPPDPSTPQETPYVRETGYALRYRDRRFAEGSGRRTHRREAAAITELLQKCDHRTPTARWLDAPCGAGRLTGLLPGIPTRVDRDFEMVRAGVAAAAAHSLSVCASLHKLPFQDGAFDGALCMRLLHHIPSAEERRRILAELHRVSRGPVLLSYFHSVSLQHLRRVVGGWFGRRRSGRSAVRWSVFRADLAAAGFEVRGVRPLSRFLSEQWVVLVEPGGRGERRGREQPDR